MFGTKLSRKKDYCICIMKINSNKIYQNKGSFTNYVYEFCSFFTVSNM